jgi:hypothetical protein
LKEEAKRASKEETKKETKRLKEEDEAALKAEKAARNLAALDMPKSMYGGPLGAKNGQVGSGLPLQWPQT